MTGDQLKSSVQSANPLDLGIVGAGLLAFILSLFPYYTASFSGGFGFSVSVNAWHGFFGWFGAFVALAAGVLVLLHVVGIKLGAVPTRLASVAGFGLATLCVLLALFVWPGGKGDCQGIKACEDAINYGHGFGYWASVLVIVAGLVLSVMRMSADD